MQEEDTWSLLPDLLLWMIRNKLDIFDNMRLDAVCRGWRSASTCFPKRLQSVGDGFPWIMQWSKDCKGTTALEFVDVVGRRRKFTIELPELYEASVIFSKQGWILLQRPNFSKSGTVRSSTSFFLINLFTKFKIKMADIVMDSRGDYHGSFSTNLDGYPNCVVLLDPDCRDQVTFRVAYPGDNEAWTQHSFLGQTIRLNGTLRMFIIRQDVYCLDKVANMIIYNTSSHTWKQVVDLEDRLILPFTMEHEGKIVKVVRDGTHVGAIMCSFFQYDDSWERLNIEDLKDTSWFLSHGGYSFSAKNKGLKAYLLCPKFDCTSINVVPQIDGHSVLLVDLTDGRREVPKLSHPLSASVSWVDIG